jgi:phenylpyruvate tautomerase PptA (4-oxalocrotonate tautomerase family)
MPLLQLRLSRPLDREKKEAVLKELSRICAETLNKPEKYVMVIIDESAIIMSGEISPAAFADVKSIGGISDTVNKALSRNICTYIKDNLGIAGDRIYLNMTDVKAGNWGWNGSTFG